MLWLRVLVNDAQLQLGKIIFGERGRNPPLLSVVFHSVLIVGLGFITYVLAIVVKTVRPSHYRVTLYAASVAYLLWIDQRIIDFATSVPWNTQNIMFYWFLAIPLAPTASLLISGWNKASTLLGKRTIEVEKEEQESRREEVARRRRARARIKSGLRPKSAEGLITVGTKIDGDQFPSHVGIQERNGWVMLPVGLFFQHCFVVGTTGAGKSQLLLRLIYEALHKTDMNIYVVDGKGELDFAYQIASMAYETGRGQVPIFKMGQGEKGAVFDGFRGDAEAISNRLAAMMSLDETTGNAKHYSDTYQSLTQLISGVGYPELDIEPPRSFEEVMERLTSRWLKNTYSKIPSELEFIDNAKQGKEDLIASARSRLATLARPLRGMVGSSGFSLEKCKCAVFSLRTQSVGSDAKKFLDFQIEDVKDFIGKRQPPGVEALLIIDEFGVFNNESIKKVLSLARSSKVGVILSTQDIATLGDDRTAREILANCNTYFLHKTNYPQELVELAGTIFGIEPSFQLEDGELTGMQSARVQHQFSISPNDAARLEPGEGFIINSRCKMQYKASMVRGIKTNERAIAIDSSEREPRGNQDQSSVKTEPVPAMPD